MPPNTSLRGPPISRSRGASSIPNVNATKPTVAQARRPSKSTLGFHKPAARRARDAVNTDLSAHPRTDPTGALNILVKLVSSLSSRIGGCQYKMSSSEHALSLHLLSIVEPFVYQGARALSTASHPSSAHRTVISGFAFQPTEILDAIMYFVDSKRDLMSLGLCCKRLHDVVFPRHFDYRVIRCKISSISVWNHLSIHRSLAGNVRTLEIMDERVKVATSVPSTGPSKTGPMVVPCGITQRDTDLDSTDDELRARGIHGKQERYLVNALQRMTGLEEFKWSCNHSPISVDKIWLVLMERAGVTLKSITVCNNLIFTVVDKSDDSSEASGGDSSDDDVVGGKVMRVISNRPVLSRLKAVSFNSTRHSIGVGKLPSMSRIVAFLERCPNIEDLAIDYKRPAGAQPTDFNTHPKIDPLFLAEIDGTRWSRLRNVRLNGLWSLTPASLAQFLSAHPTIEVLNLIGLKGIGRLDLPINSLPRLREIEASREVMNAIMGCPCFASALSPTLEDVEGFGEEVVRPIEIVKGFNLSGSHSAVSTNRSPDQAFLSNLKRHVATIKRVELGGWHDMEDLRRLAKSVPGTTYLDLGKRLGVNNAQRAGAVAPVTNLEEWLETLDDLQELRALHGVRFFYEVSLNAASGPTLVAGTTSMAPISTFSTSGLAGSTTAPSPSANFTSGNSSSTIDPPLPGTFSKGPGHAQTQLASRQMSLMDRSRTKKNDWTASMLVWRCPNLRRVDHWEPFDRGCGYGKVITLTKARALPAAWSGPNGDRLGADGEVSGLRENTTVKWEVRRVKV